MVLKNLCFLLISSASVLLSSCTTSSKPTVESTIAAQRRLVQTDSLAKKYSSGIDLVANGTSPAEWTLEIDFDKQITFRATDGKNFQLSPAFEKKEIDAGTELYVLRSPGKQVSITINNELCVSTNSKKVGVMVDNTMYTGCGAYLYDHRLHDIWILESINNDKHSGTDFKLGLPFIQLDLEKKTMSGSDGCKKFQVPMEVQGNRIKFSSFSQSTSACGYKIEKIFAEMVSGQLVNYYEQKGLLVLYLIDDSKLNFRRKDF